MTTFYDRWWWWWWQKYKSVCKIDIDKVNNKFPYSTKYIYLRCVVKYETNFILLIILLFVIHLSSLLTDDNIINIRVHWYLLTYGYYYYYYIILSTIKFFTTIFLCTYHYIIIQYLILTYEDIYTRTSIYHSEQRGIAWNKGENKILDNPAVVVPRWPM